MFKSPCLAVTLMLCGIASLPAHSQTSPPVAAAPDPAFEAAKQAYDALPLADRKAIQEALVWTGDHQGIVDGEFGRRTRDAIVSFARRAKLPADGMLDAKGRATLAAAATAAKTALRFVPVSDPRAGLRIGIPLKLMSKAGEMPGGTRFASPDGALNLEMSSLSDPADLATLFDRVKVDGAGRRVTYKILRPEFFVVAGETGPKTFYTRFARGQREGRSALHGYTFSYPTARKAGMEPVALAMANSFEPFPVAAGGAVAQGGVALGLGGTVLAPPLAHPPTPKPTLVASGVIVTNGMVLTSLPPKGCVDPTIRGIKARVAKQDKANGLSLLEVPGLKAVPISARAEPLKDGASVVLLSFAAGTPTAAAPTVSLDLTATSGATSGPGRVYAALQDGAGGSAVFDRNGALAGISQQPARTRRKVAGIVPEQGLAMVSPEKISAAFSEVTFGKNTSENKGEQTAGQIVAAARAAIVPVQCVE